MNNMLRNVFFVLIVSVCNGKKTVVRLEQGNLTGIERETYDGLKFYSFLSIPYARAPVGKLRFADPLPPEPWQGILRATTDLPSCPQVSNGKIIGREDCLYLNVHTPNVRECQVKPTLYPVIIFIHGGSLIEGSGSTQLYDAEFLMPRKIVLVTINYRLGLLGFLNSPNPDLMVPGNFGLKDQTMALKWVSKNIGKFGGDRNLVTLMGQSAGGACAHAHMFNKFSKGLFHRVIAMSGVIASQYGRGFKDSFSSVAKRLGIEGNSSKEVLEKLRGLPFGRIVEAQANQNILVPISQPIETSPNIEYNYPKALIPTDPSFQLNESTFTKVPFMLGYTDKEGLFAQIVTRLATGKPFIVDDFETFIPYNLKLNSSARESLKEEMKRFYFGNEEPSESNLESSTKLVTDSVILAGIGEILKRQYMEDQPMYLYRFSADTQLNYFKRFTNYTANIPGASHIDDLGYVFNNIYTPVFLSRSPEAISKNKFTKLITDFAKKGRPHPELQWMPYTPEIREYLSVEGVRLQSKTDPDKESFDFWSGVYNRYGRDARFVG